MFEFLKNYATIFAIVWLVSIVLSITHSFFNERELTVGDLMFMLVFGPANTIVRFSDWNTVVVRWPEKKK